MKPLTTAMIILAAVLIISIVLCILSSRRNRKVRTISVSGRYLWSDRKHSIYGFPISFTKYTLTTERLFIVTGLFNTTENEVRLYRILDLQLRETFGQKLLGLGSVVLKTSDKSMRNFSIKNISHAKAVKELLSDSVEAQRRKNGVVSREFIDYDIGDPI